MELFPAFKRRISPAESLQPVEEYKLTTEQITVNNKPKLVAVAHVVDHAESNKGLRAQDFDLATLMVTGLVNNLKPAARVSLSPLGQVDMVSQQSGYLKDVADVAIANETISKDVKPEPDGSQTPA